ncbi:MAG: RnfABCDGE type electron transport complex subunit D [Phycisphaerae bacterium]|nr:RnfABCDGE type electron transport complex subunit D [Phycisphaerae bacterium]
MTNDCWIVGGDFSARAAPHRSGGNTHQDILRSWLLAASMVAACGVALFGPAAIKVLTVAILSAVAADVAVGIATRRPVIGGLSHACLTGLLLALTLPATVRWYVPMFGSLIAIVLAKGLFGGIGHYIWQPAVVGRVVVQFLFSGQLSLVATADLVQSPILTPGHLLVGDISQVQDITIATYRGWSAAGEPVAGDAWRMKRPVQALRQFAEAKIPADGDLTYEPLLRDALPPWQDTVFGTVPGGIGETCCLALIVAGLYLIYRGYLRWQLPVAMLASAALAASVLPVETAGDGGGYHWLPIVAVEHGHAVGVAYVMYHLTAGQLMLGAFLLAGDMIATPMRARGQLVFAAGIGVLTVFMRLYGHLEGECYWSILIMNWLVSTIDRRMKRPVLGMAA